jgi:hypothetical protein
MCGLTFELTPTTEAGSVRLVRENVQRTSDQPYAACRSGSAVERGVRQHRAASAHECIAMPLRQKRTKRHHFGGWFQRAQTCSSAWPA